MRLRVSPGKGGFANPRRNSAISSWPRLLAKTSSALTYRAPLALTYTFARSGGSSDLGLLPSHIPNSLLTPRSGGTRRGGAAERSAEETREAAERQAVVSGLEQWLSTEAGPMREAEARAKAEAKARAETEAKARAKAKPAAQPEHRPSVSAQSPSSTPVPEPVIPAVPVPAAPVAEATSPPASPPPATRESVRASIRDDRVERFRGRGSSAVLLLFMAVMASIIAAIVLYATVPVFGGFESMDPSPAETAAAATEEASMIPIKSFGPTPALRFPGGSPLETAPIEEWIIQFTNEERVRAGLRPFDHDPAISEIAREHSEQMILHGLSHTVLGKSPTGRALAAGYDCRAYHGDGSYSYGLSENIAGYPRIRRWIKETSPVVTDWSPDRYYTSPKQAARGLVTGWIKSLGHRANIHDQDARRIGVGVAVELSQERGWTMETIYATQNFSSCK